MNESPVFNVMNNILLLRMIFSFLNIRDLKKCCLVSRYKLT